MRPATMMRAAARTPTYQSVSRVRTVSIIQRVARSLDGVAGTAARLNEPDGEAVVDLAPQPLDIDLDQIRHRVEAVVPDMLGDVGAPEDLSLTLHQVFEERVLLGRQLNGAARPLDAAGTRVDDEILDGQYGRGERRPAPQQRPDARQQFPEVIRLWQVIVGAGVQALDAFVETAAGRQHEDWDRRSCRPKLAAHIQAVHHRQHDVEDEEVVIVGADLLECGLPVRGDVHGVGMFAQALGEHRGCGWLIFDDEYSHQRLPSRWSPSAPDRSCS